MFQGRLLSSAVPYIFAAPGVYDVRALFTVCSFYVLFYWASGAVLPRISAACTPVPNINTAFWY